MKTLFFSKKHNISCKNCTEILLQYQNRHLVYWVQSGILQYQHVTSPGRCGGAFPDGYFAVRQTQLPPDAQHRVNILIRSAAQCPLSEALDILPPGASHEALMICTKKTGQRLYYSNCHLSESRFSVCRDPVHPSFWELFSAFQDFCDFVTDRDSAPGC